MSDITLQVTYHSLKDKEESSLHSTEIIHEWQHCNMLQETFVTQLKI